MFRRNSIFVKILIPIIIIIILQPFLISSVLFVYGIFGSLDESAVDSISNNAENRSLVLSDKMVSAWSNLDRLEFDVINTLDDFMAGERLLLTNVIGNSAAEVQLLRLLSDPLINTLRQTTATGAYIYFIDDSNDDSTSLNGLYYRNPDPLTLSPDNSDLLLLRGPVDIAGSKRIPLDIFWQGKFSFTPEYPDNYKTFNEPYTAARQSRFKPANDLAYWSNAILINPDNPGDSNYCITYTRPVTYEGRVVAMIGTEVQLSNLERYLSASDFSFDRCGYVLLKHSYEDYIQDNQTIDSEVIFVTGDYIRQLTAGMNNIRFSMTNRQDIYSVDEDDFEPVQAALRPLSLYSENSPFFDEQWTVAAIGSDYTLFWMTRMLTVGIIVSSAIALAIGTLLLWFTIKRTTGPIVSIAGQLSTNAPAEHIIVKDSNTYEISLLCSTINNMKDQRTISEAELRTERERYLVALESVADTVIEYDILEDSFIMYYFAEEENKSVLHSNEIRDFTDAIKNGEFCHDDDINIMMSFFKGDDNTDVEVRIKAEIFSHISDAMQDNGYYWFFLKSSKVYNNTGGIIKIIGTAREFTEKKLRDYQSLESSRRDPTTKLFNHDYGVNMTKRAVTDALRNNTPFSLSIISISNYDEIEAHYGRVFAASILMKLFIDYPATDNIVKTRLSNDEVLLFIPNTDRDEAAGYAERFFEGAESLYTGENSELRLSICIGTVLSADADNFDTFMEYAFKTAHYVERSNEGGIEFYSDLPKDIPDDTVANRNRPINVSFEVVKGDISNYTFELFESTTDTHSAVNMLIAVLGRVYSLKQITISTYDADFGTGRITHEWNENGISNQSYAIEKVSQNDWQKFEAKLDENGSLLYSGADMEQSSEALRRLLCVEPGVQTGGYCCVMYESGIPFGRILYQTFENSRQWFDAELKELYEISKIIAVNLNSEKSLSASRAKSAFLSRISHEIRTPMNAIIGMTNIAKNSLNNNERLLDSLQKIDFSAQHLLSLINNVLEMSRIESGKMDIEYKYFSLDKFARDIDMLMRPPIEENEISFDIAVNVSNQFQILGDEIKLRQVIINLLGNASKFTQKNGSITLTINELGLEGRCIYLFFSVKDNGMGIAPEEQSSIFKTFEQTSTISSSHKQQGSGLGLAISAGIVTAMGGTIQLESKPGKGSEFYFTLKLDLISDKTLENDEKDLSVYYKNIFTGKTALVVDDIDINLEIAKYILEDVGFNVETAMDGQEAVNMFLSSADGQYDVIMMDIQMPVMDGLAATRNIRKNREHPNARTVPIIAMTADAFDEDMNESIESGMNGYITKPIDIDRFYQELHAVLFD
ncbi:MAG: ATP-binding protein [Oscillospiraceae bacterium]|nr:ATP-binding protein [Oscillospiraceae bacterium]